MPSSVVIRTTGLPPMTAHFRSVIFIPSCSSRGARAYRNWNEYSLEFFM